MRRQQRLRIALVTDDFYPASGGIGRSIQTQISELVSLGHEVTLLAPRHFLERPTGCKTVVVSSFYIPGTPSHMCVLKCGRRSAWRICRQHRFDIIHSQTERGGLMLAARIAKEQGIPHIHTFHANLAGTHTSQPFGAFWGSMAYLFLINPMISMIADKRLDQPVFFAPKSPDAPGVLARFDWHTMATVASRVDAFTAPADFMTQRISDCASWLDERSHIVPTGVNPKLSHAIAHAKRHRTDRTIRFLSVCRLAPEKRVDAIIRAFIQADLPNAELHIIGDGKQLKLRLLAEKHRGIIFHGHVSCVKQMAEAFVNADVFVLASHGFDTQAMTIGEAVTAGLPIIYCDPRLTVGTTKDNSILARDPSVEQLAAAMRQMADDTRRRQMARASSRLASELSPEHMTSQYLTIYRDLIARTV